MEEILEPEPYKPLEKSQLAEILEATNAEYLK